METTGLDIKKDIVPNYFVVKDKDGNEIRVHKNLMHENAFDEVKIKDKRMLDLTNTNSNNWHVLYYLGNRKWLCQCSCGRYSAISGYNLNYKKSNSCGHERIEDLTGKQIGEWKVLSYAGTNNGMTRWLCECSCTKKKIVYAAKLKNGMSKSCGHDKEFIDMTGQTFGEWTVLEYVGNYYWRCRCSCNREKIVYGLSLRRGESKSCGHLSDFFRRQTLMAKYGDVANNKHREEWQIETVSSKDKLLQYILNKDHKPTALELANELDISTTNIYRKIHSYGLEQLIYIEYNSSKYESELIDILESITTSRIETRNHTAINGQELDIYIPDKKIAIEFNGDYWHSELHKDKYYHQQKTVECIKRGIQLVHIFEHEWKDSETKQKIITMLNILVNDNISTVNACNTNDIVEVSNEESKDFLEINHIKGYEESTINIGYKLNNRLIALITFNKTNGEFQYELTRICTVSDIKSVNCIENMFKYFINKYSPNSIVSYCDISKFNGNTYLNLGFKANISMLSDPNYIWYNLNEKDILDNNNLDESMMNELGYAKVYDSGVMKFEWRR